MRDEAIFLAIAVVCGLSLVAMGIFGDEPLAAVFGGLILYQVFTSWD